MSVPKQAQAPQRFQHPDPQTNRIVQDLYDRLGAIGAATGPGAGTYTLAPAATQGGKPAQITLDQLGRVVRIQTAS